MTRHRLAETRTVYAPTHTETRSLGALAGGLVPIAGLAVLASFYSGPVAAVVPPELSSAQPAAAVPLFTVPVKPVISVVDFVANSGRAAGKDDGDSVRAASGASRSGSPSSPHGARAHLQWGDAREPHHHFEGQRHEHWAASSPDGGHRRVRDGHWLHSDDHGEPGRHGHLDGHHDDRGDRGHHGDSAGRHHRSDHHVGGHHQGAHSHGGHHAHR